MPEFSPESAASAASDLAACRAMMQGGSRSFFAASLLLPRRVHQPAAALYAFCRQADDAVDLGDARPAALDVLLQRLDSAYAGRPQDNAADRAFAAVVARYSIPRALPLALLEGFGWDLRGRRYPSLAALHDYAARVAGSVGAMMAVLMGVRSESALARACDLGVAMQLTNIARDVGEDARAGRLYLPLDWMEEAGLDPATWLADPVFSPALGGVVRKLLQAADTLYARSAAGIAALPPRCRPGIRAAGLIYAEIGRAIADAGHDSVTMRARVPGLRKAALMARSLTVPAFNRAAGAETSALSACQYLVAACVMEAPAPLPRRFTPAQTLNHRNLWIVDLFKRLPEQQVELP